MRKNNYIVSYKISLNKLGRGHYFHNKPTFLKTMFNS